MQKSKETASDMAASAKAGMEKARATVGGKTEMTMSDSTREEMAEDKKDERIREAEREKQVAFYQSAAERMALQGGGAVFTTGGVHVLQQPDVGGEGVTYEDKEVNRPARGPAVPGTRGNGTGPTGGL